LPTVPIQPTHTSVVEVDRRLVTVLFADLVDWTQLAAGLDPEDVRAVQQAFFAAVTPPIAAHGGSVEKYIGDAVLAVFGVPEVHEDDPERAVRAALGMQEAVVMLNATLVRTHGLRLALRIGSHCGLVVAERGQDGVSFSVSGDTANYAFHLQKSAAPNTVLVSCELQRWIAHAFETVEVGLLQLHPGADVYGATAYRVLRARAEAHKLRGVSGLDSPLVGRELELAALGQALERLAAGRGGIVTLSGDAGIGKSRLIAELKKLAPADCQWVEGRCLSYASATPYHLWLSLLRGVLGARLDEPSAAVAELLRRWVATLCPDSQDAVLPHLARLLALPPDDASQTRLAGLSAQARQQGILAAAETIVGRAANRRPLVLVCEDLHWADPSSLALLEHLLPLPARTPLLLVCVFRTEIDRSHPVWRIGSLVHQNHPQCHP
jgi:class 3 adenylate cyclase